MDRIKEAQPISSSLTHKSLGLLAFLLVILLVLAYKSYDDGWFLPRKPIILNDQPAVLFFNRHKGCDCARVVYYAAARQMREWPEAQHLGVQLIQVDLDRQPYLGEQFDVARAPALLLIDAAGNIKYRQEEVVTDLEPMNLPLLEQNIREVVGK
jgi:hypothetical protein